MPILTFWWHPESSISNNISRFDRPKDFCTSTTINLSTVYLTYLKYLLLSQYSLCRRIIECKFLLVTYLTCSRLSQDRHNKNFHLFLAEYGSLALKFGSDLLPAILLCINLCKCNSQIQFANVAFIILAGCAKESS